MRAALLGVLCLTFFCAVLAQPERRALQKLLFNPHYDPQTRPFFNTSKPVVVEVQYRINSLYDVDSKNENFRVDLWVNEWWLDPRLAYDGNRWKDALEDGKLRVPNGLPWKPDTFFFNALSCTTNDQVILLDPIGRLLWSRHQVCTFRSDFDLRLFPFDTQSLYFGRQSYSYPNTDLVIRTMLDGCYSPDPLTSFENSLWNLKNATCEDTEVYFRDFQPSYSMTRALIVVERQSQNYVVKLILPMFVIVFVSTLSYFIDANAAPARVAFSITLVLSMVTFNWIVSADLPKINYSTLLDWYVWKCFLYAIVAVAEFAVVNHIVTSKKYDAIYGHLVDDFFQFTLAPVWIMGNIMFWPILDSAAEAMVAIAMASWIGFNAYRVRWNFFNQKRGMSLLTDRCDFGWMCCFFRVGANLLVPDNNNNKEEQKKKKTAAEAKMRQPAPAAAARAGPASRPAAAAARGTGARRLQSTAPARR